jgi:hypothetical protein
MDFMIFANIYLSGFDRAKGLEGFEVLGGVRVKNDRHKT